MPPIQVSVVPVTPFAQNCSILVCTATKRAAVVDPGGDVARIRAALDDLGVAPEKILLTHGHIDHAGGAAELADALDVPIEGPHADDAFLLRELEAQGRMFGLSGARAVAPGRFLVEGNLVKVGALAFDVLHIPGHTPGHVVFVQPQARIALVGDTLFAGSIGRTDFPYGDHDTLIHGIATKLVPLGDDLAFLPGHGPASTIGAERQSNPFLQA